jgi:hypothetical protein
MLSGMLSANIVPIFSFRIRPGLAASLAIAVWLAWPIPPAAAEDDPCILLPTRLAEAAKQAISSLPEKERPKETDLNKPSTNVRYAADELVSKVAPFDAKTHNDNLASGSPTWVTFDSGTFKTVEISRICLKVYVPAEGRSVPLQQVVLTEKDQAKTLKVVFNAESSATRLYWPWATVDYLVFGVIAGKPATTTPPAPAVDPTFFAHRATIKVADGTETVFISLLFLAALYAALAWATYPREEDPAKPGEPKAAEADKPQGETPDEYQVLAEGKWFLFAASPVRISAAWFGEASMAQLQVLIFTFVVGGLMLNLFLRTGSLTDLSMDLLKLIGISAVGTAGAKFTQTLKTSLKSETARYLIGKGWYQWKLSPIQNTATFRQLLLTDNRLDVYKFQMLIFTVIVALYVISAGQAGLEGVKISETMIYLLGISQIVYVGGKAVTDRTTDLEEAAAKMRDLESKLKAVKSDAMTDEQKQWLGEYRKAAETAAEEFAFLQNRIVPRENPNDSKSKPSREILAPNLALQSA